MCQLLQAAGSDWVAQNAADHTPLHKAASRGATSLCAWLLAEGGALASIDMHDADGHSALALAELWGQRETAALLLLHGAARDVP